LHPSASAQQYRLKAVGFLLPVSHLATRPLATFILSSTAVCGNPRLFLRSTSCWITLVLKCVSQSIGTSRSKDKPDSLKCKEIGVIMKDTLNTEETIKWLSEKIAPMLAAKQGDSFTREIMKFTNLKDGESKWNYDTICLTSGLWWAAQNEILPDKLKIEVDDLINDNKLMQWRDK
tara:strand:- start:1040 stop:1567 length:528 start_codon:yes stop_codon:yes gene_type:complete